ncbi:hypothetical protein E3N88_27215 [Mikania micrantha]|uniref:Uncharacterized protein n=1 Tax=Mikania micrantha TaxID=192012 RepID=A0A5N6MXK6_9ASTR|nr:hypothetical protein E3N88_27215 [Mikania micrantha]
MGTEVLQPQACFINVGPVIVTKNANNNDDEKMGSASRREVDVKLDCEKDDDWYAGSGFFNSPSPKSLPFPSFFNKKQENPMAMVADHEATKQLCRLLRLSIDGRVRLQEYCTINMMFITLYV